MTIAAQEISCPPRCFQARINQHDCQRVFTTQRVNIKTRELSRHVRISLPSPTPDHPRGLKDIIRHHCLTDCSSACSFLFPLIPPGMVLGHGRSLCLCLQPSQPHNSFYPLRSCPGCRISGAKLGESQAKWDKQVTVTGELCPCKFA